MILAFESERYRDAGTSHAAAWEKMSAAAPSWATPPSFEVFEYGRKVASSALRSLNPMQLASQVIEGWM